MAENDGFGRAGKKMVLEYRRDLAKGGLVVVANERSKRPESFGKVSCPFCRGAEHITPPATLELPSKKNWRVRAFRNLFAVARFKEKFKKEGLAGVLGVSPAFGDHEVIVESDVHGRLLQEFSEEELLLVFNGYKNRFSSLSREKKIECVYLFKNHGRLAGASIDHEHAQILALPFVPPVLKAELDSFEKFEKEKKKCFYCDFFVSQKENVLFENDSAKAFCPSFGRFPFEVWVLPKRHAKTIADLSEAEGLEFMLLIQKSVKALENVCKDYNIAFHCAPKGKNFHFHAEIYPRTNVWAGIELGAGIAVNIKTEKEALQALKKNF